MPTKNLPIVAIIGRPNVGKSALFNRLIGKRMAIVEDIPGVTRDRNYGEGEWSGRSFTLIDTGGFIPGSLDHIDAEVRKQAEFSINEADVIVFLVDGQVGFMDQDIEVANILRKSKKPVLLAVNKIDNPMDFSSWSDFYRLGLGTPNPISAIHGHGVADLLDEVNKVLPQKGSREDLAEAAKICIVGRPNVGKSSIINQLLGQDRAIVSDIAGTTRDSIDSYLKFEDDIYVLIDTAGVRRKAKVDENLEYYTVNRAMQSIRRADLAVLVIDAREGVTAQDARLAGYIAKQGTSCIIVVNKWDLVEDQVDQFLKEFKRREEKQPVYEDENFPLEKKTRKELFDAAGNIIIGQLPKNRGANIETAMREYVKHVQKNMYFMTWAPVVFTSALNGKRIFDIMEQAKFVMEERKKRVSTAQLNRFLKTVVDHWQPPEKHGKEIRLYYMAQTDTTPPHFTLFVNLPKSIPDEYFRYIMNCIRKEFGFIGTPVTMNIRAKKKLE
jgi:GTP-binding protein